MAGESLAMKRVSKKKVPASAKGRGAEYSADRLMRAALDLFAQRDFSSVTIKDISAESGVNAALIYYYYKSKEDLFRAALEFAIKKALERYAALRNNNSDPVHLIDEWFRSNLEMAGLVRQLVKIMLDYSSSKTRIASVERLIAEFYSTEENEILAGTIRQGIESGMFRSVDASEIARFVSVQLDGIIVASIIRKQFDTKKAFEVLQKVLWGYLGRSEIGSSGESRPPSDAVKATRSRVVSKEWN